MPLSVGILKQKFKLKDLMKVYLTDVKEISTTGLTATELRSRNAYIAAIEAVRDTGIMDMVRYALSFGRELSGQAQKFHDALPILVCWHVQQPNKVDKAYAQILYQYASEFKIHRRNLRDVMLGFVINSSLSPVKSYFDQQLEHTVKRAAQITKF